MGSPTILVGGFHLLAHIDPNQASQQHYCKRYTHDIGDLYPFHINYQENGLLPNIIRLERLNHQ